MQIVYPFLADMFFLIRVTSIFLPAFNLAIHVLMISLMARTRANACSAGGTIPSIHPNRQQHHNNKRSIVWYLS
jgi:hypothetical protein